MSSQVVSGGLLPHSRQRKHALLSGRWPALIVCSLLFVAFAQAATPPTIDEMLESSPSQRAAISPAELNLLCARGLPGGQEIDNVRNLAALDHWTALVRGETDQRLASLARRDRSARERLNGSNESRCKAQALLQGVHDALGSDRRPASLESGTLEAAVARDIPLDPRDLFLSGVL